MRTEIHHQYPRVLPADDGHPYRSGAWRPQQTEYDAWDLDVVGVIPDDLAGTYLRNTENPLLPPIKRYHPFDGDGMLHAITFGGGEARYHNRFVPTDGFLAEREAGQSLWAGVGENPAIALREDGKGAKPHTKDASSTDVVVHRGVALTSFYLCGDLYRFDPVSLDALGKESFSGRMPTQGVSAHPKIDEVSAEMLIFNYETSAPYLHYGVVSATGELDHYIDVPLPGPRLPHDLAFTENYTIFNDLPLFWDPQALTSGRYASRYFPELPSRFGIVPRRGQSSEIRWFEAQPTYVLHWINAFEDGDEIVLDGFHQGMPEPPVRPDLSFDENFFRYLDLHTLQTRPHRWRFNLKTGECREQRLSDTITEFGMINGRFGGRPYRYYYSALPARGWFGFEGVIKHDLQTGSETTVRLPPGVYASETVMAPRIGATREDDGYLLTFTMDVNADLSECLILDAQQPAAEPVARIRLPERICSGTHAFWHSASEE
jgi:carotenoid cleavage dioxygenase-like enzyme